MINWSTACPDWGARLKAGRSIIPPPIFPAEAEAALAVFKSLHIADAVGSPTFGESCAEWVFDLVRSIFGAYDSESGRRLIKEWFVQVPKKNSKSTIAAGIMLTDLIRNWRRSSQSTILAPTVTISKNSFDPARDMCSQDLDPELHNAMQVQSHVKTITNRATDAMLKVLAAETDTVGGSKSGTILVDELWLFGKRADAESMMREATGGLLSRPEGMVIYLTTQSDEPPAGVYAQKLEYARDVRDGRVVDPTFCPVIYEFPPDMIADESCFEPENFHIVNPNLGYSVDRQELNRLYLQAKSDGKKESLRLFYAKHLNIQIGMSMMANRWPGADFWERCGVEGLTLGEILETSDVVDVGADGGGLDDLLGLSILGRDRKTRKWRHWGHAWAHPIVLERRKSEAPKLLDFEKAGDLTISEHMGDDVDDLAEIVADIHKRNLLDKVGVDPAGIGGLIDALTRAGVPQDKILGVSQGWRLTGAIKTAERKLAEGMVEHCCQPLMAWSMGNARQEPRGNAVVITKQASGTAKIDPTLAFINSVALMSLNPQGKPNVGAMVEDPVMA